jgi:hypothetical protein
LSGLVPARGKVTLNDKPVEGATVSFVPQGQSRSAVATTDANGNFKMMTLNPGDGAEPGEYKVVVSKTETIEPKVDPRAYQDKSDIPFPPTEIIYYLPQKYSETETTDLTITLSSKGDKNIEFKLTGKVDTTPVKSSR